ncbi:hypothetical protein QR680_009467 [Steinernema hermaphroditum]|uniref:Uncharacterized protein n=1 Tax=Steinernema hermaphroditum TaxID=289476 RepID=A0AA39M9G6_9BILA|nr:hypothetical protein QR680_009467 [Steinernema hermaphroditum]
MTHRCFPSAGPVLRFSIPAHSRNHHTIASALLQYPSRGEEPLRVSRVRSLRRTPHSPRREAFLGRREDSKSVVFAHPLDKCHNSVVEGGGAVAGGDVSICISANFAASLPN